MGTSSGIWPEGRGAGSERTLPEQAQAAHANLLAPTAIWASDARGQSAFVSREWELMTGQSAEEARGHGWTSLIHPDDAEVIQAGFQEACLRCEAFWLIYRLRVRSGGYAWVLAGATPSRSPTSGEFLGFLGSVTPIELLQPIGPHAEIGLLRAAAPDPAEPPKSHLDMLKDLVGVARNIAAEAGEPEIREAVDQCLTLVRKRLNEAPSSGHMLM